MADEIEIPDVGQRLRLGELSSLSRSDVEQMRFQLGSAGPLAQSVLNSNAYAFLRSLPLGVTAEAGMIIAYAKQPTWSAPNGWLECDGSTVSKATYPKLYSVIGDEFTGSPSANDFDLPTISPIATNVRYVVKF